MGTLATPAGPDDVVVARVNGRPVWGSCVAGQARGRGLAIRAALADCIDLEVAAQEAERRGLAADPEVAEEAERAMVARFVDREFTARVRSPADLPRSFVEGVMTKHEWRLARDEYRGSFYARVEAPIETVPRGSPADVAAEKIARDAYATLAGRRDLFPRDVEAALRAAAGPAAQLTFASFPGTTGDNVQAYYREALFAIGALGEVSPPARGPYGWDLVLWTTTLPALTQTREEVLAQLWPAMRQRHFLDWAAQTGRGHQVEASPAPVVERVLGSLP